MAMTKNKIHLPPAYKLNKGFTLIELLVMIIILILERNHLYQDLDPEVHLGVLKVQ